jgi:hypothetical protein
MANVINPDNVSEVTNSSGLVNFSSKQILADMIEGGNCKTRASLSSFVENGTFVSLMDEIRPDADCLTELSPEEKDTILTNHLNYYSAFGYDNLIPNENFARLLNWKGEIIVNDSLYRITPLGTFCTSDVNNSGSQNIESCYQRLISGDSLCFNSNSYLRLNSNVILYNSFPESKFDGQVISTRASGAIPLKHYSSTASNGWVWKEIGKLLGDRSTKHFEYISKRRVDGSLYDYDYLVYHESGAFVSASKKRGGFFRKINGWKDICADELSITCKNMMFVLDYKTPSTISFPKEFQFVNNSNLINTNMSTRPLKSVDILGYDIPAKALFSAIKGGVSFALDILKKELNHSISPDTRVVRILTPNKCYIYLLESETTDYNCNKIRKVFNSGWNFYISSDILSNPLSFKSAKDFFDGVRSIPVEHIESGRVILLTKIDNQWGGLVMDKNYDGNDECIIK